MPRAPRLSLSATVLALAAACGIGATTIAPPTASSSTRETPLVMPAERTKRLKRKKLRRSGLPPRRKDARPLPDHLMAMWRTRSPQGRQRFLAMFWRHGLHTDGEYAWPRDVAHGSQAVLSRERAVRRSAATASRVSAVA